jgi:glutamate-1-semialdehyde aminotransferase
MPISILTGKKDIMNLLEKDVFFFTTFGGESLSLAAAKATIEFMQVNNVPEYLFGQGRKLKDGYNNLALRLDMNYTKCSGYNFRSIISFDSSAGNPLELKSLMQQELIKKGILWQGFHNISYSHSDRDIDYTLEAYREVLPILKKAVEEKNILKYLKGKPVEPVFRKTGNFNIKPLKNSVKVFDDFKL